VDEAGGFHPFHAGRIRRASDSEFVLQGVLPDVERDRIIQATASQEFRKTLQEMLKASSALTEERPTAVVTLENEPRGFERGLNGVAQQLLTYDSESRSFTIHQPLKEKEAQALLVSAGHPEFRAAVRKLASESQQFRVSPWWLFWSYILATLGELCLSPVGLSMVSKLAPARFATIVMGAWLFISALGNYVAGLMGEQWGRIPPIQYFIFTTVVVAVAALILLVLSRLIAKMMHGVD
jgi:POT family proton-dependent oligopeptide transporter